MGFRTSFPPYELELENLTLGRKKKEKFSNLSSEPNKDTMEWTSQNDSLKQKMKS